MKHLAVHCHLRHSGSAIYIILAHTAISTKSNSIVSKIVVSRGFGHTEHPDDSTVQHFAIRGDFLFKKTFHSSRTVRFKLKQYDAFVVEIFDRVLVSQMTGVLPCVPSSE